MGIALADAGLDLSSFDGVRCWSGHSPGHILRAEELAIWLASQSEVGRFVRYSHRKSAADFQGRRGIIFIKDGWGAGDHIDPWDGIHTKKMLAGEPSWIAKGRQIWFWSL